MSNQSSAPTQSLPVVLAAGDYPNMDVVKAAITSAVLVYAQESVTVGKLESYWAPWVSNSMPIDVLLANRSAFRKSLMSVRNMEHAITEVGRARALALTPSAPADYPRPLNSLMRLQVSFPEKSSREKPMRQDVSKWPIVAVDYEHGTAQVVAAGIRAVLGWFMKLTHEEQVAWYDPGCKFSLLGMDRDAVEHLSVYAGAHRSVGKADDQIVAVAIAPSDLKR